MLLGRLGEVDLKMNGTNYTQVRSLPMTSSLETEWDDSGRKGRGGQK